MPRVFRTVLGAEDPDEEKKSVLVDKNSGGSLPIT